MYVTTMRYAPLSRIVRYISGGTLFEIGVEKKEPDLRWDSGLFSIQTSQWGADSKSGPMGQDLYTPLSISEHRRMASIWRIRAGLGY
jgi:hypothetical protein